MARNATPLLRAHPLPELHGGVELLIVESRLAHPDPSGDSGYEEEHSLCVLILVAPSEVDRRRMRSEAQRYIAAQATVVPVPGVGWAADVVQMLHEIDAAFMDVVIGLPEHAAKTEQHLMALLQGLNGGHHVVCTAVAVARDHSVWQAFDDLLGMVSASGRSAAESALWLHSGLAQVAAPQLLGCVSREELQCVWGTATHPAQMALMDLDGSTSESFSRLLADPAQSVILSLAPLTLNDYKGLRQFAVRVGARDSPVLAPSGLTLPPARRQAVCVFRQYFIGEVGSNER